MAKNRPAKAGPTRKHMARLEVERRQILAIRLIAILVVVAVIGLIGYSYLDANFLQTRQPVATVNGEKISTSEFQMRVRLERQRLINSYLQMYQYAQLFGFDPTEQLAQIENMLGPFGQLTLGQDILDAMIDEALIRQEAARRGITVTDEEIEQAIQEFFGYFPNGTPTPAPTATQIAYSTLSPQQLALATITPTPTLYPTPVISPTPTRDPAEPTSTPAPTATVVPTSTPFTQEGYQTVYQENLDSYAGIGMSDANFRRFFENQLLYGKLLDEIAADVSRTQDQVWARHILVADEAIANLIREELLGGADFAELAAQFSTDTGSQFSGGDLGWAAYEAYVPEFAAAAFDLKIGEISQPVQSQFGWHVIQVLGREERPLDEDTYQTARERVMAELLTALREQSEIEIFEYWTERVPTDPSLDSLFQ